VRDELAILIRGLLPSYALLGACMLVVSASNALGWPLRAMLMSCARLFVCYLPCLWLGAQWGGVVGVALGAALGNGLAGGLALLLYRRSISVREIE
jgi:Na+-driven multidrug efflux pump